MTSICFGFPTFFFPLLKSFICFANMPAFLAHLLSSLGSISSLRINCKQLATKCLIKKLADLERNYFRSVALRH